MTATNDLTIRPLSGPGELGLFTQLPYVLNDELAGDLQAGHRRPEWLWAGLRGGRLTARAAWWAMRGQDTPYLLDILDLDDALPGSADDAAELLTTAMAAIVAPGTRPPEYLRFLPPDWRAQEATRQPVENRMRVAERAGARLFVERLRLEWRAGSPLPAPAGRLTFRAVRGEEEILALMTDVLTGTLDAHNREDLTRMPPEAAAARHYHGELARYTSPRDWWRVAELPGGEPAGFVIPADNGYSPIIAYLGVRPAHRGRGYISEILAEGMRILAAGGATVMRASTDLGNVPMANAFRRAGWLVTGNEIDMTWPA